jgi:cellulose synthase/poly-beta-1,6-N-acetylglucosamine synthase-like glycosyltransferase
MLLGTCGILLVHAVAGYPLLMMAAARLARRPVRYGPCRVRVSVLMAVRNEEAAIAGKLRALLQLEDAELIDEILVGSDGSTDGTEAAVRAREGDRIRLIRFDSQRGKAAVLNDLAAASRGDVLLFADTRQAFAPDALRRLLAPLHDPGVGVVSAALHQPPPASGLARLVLHAYWRAERALRAAESATGSTPGATGAGYVLRRALWQPLPADTILDDMAAPMAAIRLGMRCILEPAAVLRDEAPGAWTDEESRRRRTLCGLVQLALRNPGWCIPDRSRIAFRWISHRVLRAALPFLLLGLGAGLAGTAGMQAPVRFAAGLALAGIVAADLAAAFLRDTVLGCRLPASPLALAWADYVRGRHRRGWK